MSEEEMQLHAAEAKVTLPTSAAWGTQITINGVVWQKHHRGWFQAGG